MDLFEMLVFQQRNSRLIDGLEDLEFPEPGTQLIYGQVLEGQVLEETYNTHV